VSTLGDLGLVVRKLITGNPSPGLNIVQGFWLSCLKVLPLLILCDNNNLKATKIKLLSKNNLLDSTSLWIESELKIDTNPGLA